MVFRKKFSFKKPVSRVVVYATAMGVYRLDVNGVKAGDRYFAPGFTSYKHTLQYQTYDVTALAEENNGICVYRGRRLGGRLVRVHPRKQNFGRQAGPACRNKGEVC
ncbi:MAG TPA: alpha-L-rhamnosidase N-terminal domain-containing protein [Candidatus Coproplasma stercorigallinarum]|nr:alpha-L-rhamnosidase N-terminal domain-containing protein [Candidatus Coproplasma stercorigallinarum]